MAPSRRKCSPAGRRRGRGRGRCAASSDEPPRLFPGDALERIGGLAARLGPRCRISQRGRCREDHLALARFLLPQQIDHARDVVAKLDEEVARAERTRAGQVSLAHLTASPGEREGRARNPVADDHRAAEQAEEDAAEHHADDDDADAVLVRQREADRVARVGVAERDHPAGLAVRAPEQPSETEREGDADADEIAGQPELELGVEEVVSQAPLAAAVGRPEGGCRSSGGNGLHDCFYLRPSFTARSSQTPLIEASITLAETPVSLSSLNVPVTVARALPCIMSTCLSASTTTSEVFTEMTVFPPPSATSTETVGLSRISPLSATVNPSSRSRLVNDVKAGARALAVPAGASMRTATKAL